MGSRAVNRSRLFAETRAVMRCSCGCAFLTKQDQPFRLGNSRKRQLVLETNTTLVRFLPACATIHRRANRLIGRQVRDDAARRSLDHLCHATQHVLRQFRQSWIPDY